MAVTVYSKPACDQRRPRVSRVRVRAADERAAREQMELF